MVEEVMRVSNIGKKYKIITNKENKDTFAAVLLDSIKGGFGKSKKDEGEFWALKDVSFTVNRGERVGIIGHNGAGKSTLLKVFSRITVPTEGQVEVKGRIASLLEVGTGFNMELTGRENIYLNGSILGMNRQEIDSKFNEIVEFSEVGDFLDVPVKRYSSGMFVKLAFAVAAHLDPDILIVDEVLAVGDMKFQQKCLGKMEDVAGGGRTVLYVSHSMRTIQQLCNRVIVMDHGKVIYDGDVDEGIKIYMDNVKESGTYVDCTNIKRMNHLTLNRPVDILSIEVLDKDECIFDNKEKMNLRITWKYKRDIEDLCMRFEVRYADDTSVGTSFIHNFDSGKSEEIRSRVFECDIEYLAPGNYKTLLVAYGVNEFGNYDDYDAIWPAITFKKLAQDKSIESNWNHHGWGHTKMPDLVIR